MFLKSPNERIRREQDSQEIIGDHNGPLGLLPLMMFMIVTDIGTSQGVD